MEEKLAKKKEKMLRDTEKVKDEEDMISKENAFKIMYWYGMIPTEEEFVEHFGENENIPAADLETCIEDYWAGGVMAADELRKAFEKFDTNGDGTIDLDELKKILHGAMPEEDIEAEFAEMDVNEDGRISYEEFIKPWEEDEEFEQCDEEVIE